MRLWQQKAALQASDTLLGPGKANANDVRPLFRGGIERDTNSFRFVDVLCCYYLFMAYVAPTWTRAKRLFEIIAKSEIIGIKL